jgi:NADPH-dependent glutamate synthase beta subunit-like oxidoreductase
VALIGAGCASLAVANDLMPLGYQCTIFEAQEVAGGLMRYNIPSFRLPIEVLNEEIAYIVDMGVEVHYNHRIESMKTLLEQGYDAVFVGTGAPRGKELKLPGRYDADNIYIGIDWLESVAFGHIDSIGENVLIIGVGNTAMDCCRTSLRLGAKSVKVMARKPREFFKASDWELEDAEEENVEIIVNHSPKEFVIEDGRLKGMTFELMEYIIENGRILDQKVTGETFIPCDDVVLAIGQENAFPWIERDLGIEFGPWEEPVVDEVTFESTLNGVFFGGDSAFLHEWSYSNSFDPAARRKMMHVPLEKRFTELGKEVELGFDAEQTAQEVERCLNCDIQTVFIDSLCIECDACLDICPTQCLTITANGEEQDLVTRLKAPVLEPDQPLFVSDELKQTSRVMVKDENFCIHCGMCAERCPTAAWDMQKSLLIFPKAVDHNGGNESGERPCQQRKAG